MDTRQHNDLIIKCYQGNSHLKHILTQADIHKMAVIEEGFPLTKLPVCSHCEGLGLWHKGRNGETLGVCRKCGTYTKDPLTYSNYLAKNYDVDKTGATFRNMSKAEKLRRKKNDLHYLPNYNIGGN